MTTWEVGETLNSHGTWCPKRHLPDSDCNHADCKVGDTFILRDGRRVALVENREIATELVRAANVMEQDGR